MSKTLIIAEKPSVAADIARIVGASQKDAHAYVGNDYVVSWALGHLLEFLPPEGYDDTYKRWRLKDLPITPDGFKLTPVKGSTKQLNSLKKFIKSKEVKRVVNACDAGREGELIFREIYRYSGSKKPVDRLWIQSMTSEALETALANPRTSDDVQGLADAADCRAESDWLIGMNATRALTVRLRSARDRVVWSAGRVQTATLAILVKREREILRHTAVPYWQISAKFEVDGGLSYEGDWFNPDSPAPRDRIFDTKDRDRVIKLLEDKPQAQATETRKDSRETGPPLFDLTSLQREANRRFGFSARRTLRAAQALYERHKLITYPRTSSRALPGDYGPHVEEALRFLSTRSSFGAQAEKVLEQGLQNTKRNFNDSAVTDHFAIVPTGQGDPSKLSGDDQRIFDLVARRFVASFHMPAISTEVERITTAGADRFRTRRKVLKVPGWRAVWDREGKTGDDLPPLPEAEGTAVATLEHTVAEKETKPLPRLTEASLLGLMETAGKTMDDERQAQVLKETGGLGTPATRAEIIETLLARQYATRCTGLEGRKAMRATPRGIRLISALERIELPGLTSAELTADLEDSLRDVERGGTTRKTYMGEILDWTQTIVDRIRDFSFDTLYQGEPPVGSCPACKADVIENLRTYSCPDCEFVVWKEIRGRHVDRETAITLLKELKTPLKAGFFSRDGREYRGQLQWTKEDGIEVLAEGQESGVGDDDFEIVDLGPCPFHEDKKIQRTPRGYRCEGFKKKECGLSIPLEVCKRALSVDEVSGLIGSERKTGLLEGFTSKRNRPFAATLHLTDAAKLRWEFPPRRAGGSGGAPAKEFPVNPEPLGTCPLCKSGKVVESATSFCCDGEGACGKLNVPREICKRELTRTEALDLVNSEATPMLEGFISKAGKPFVASLYLKKNGRHGFRFQPRN